MSERDRYIDSDIDRYSEVIKVLLIFVVSLLIALMIFLVLQVSRWMGVDEVGASLILATIWAFSIKWNEK